MLKYIIIGVVLFLLTSILSLFFGDRSSAKSSKIWLHKKKRDFINNVATPIKETINAHTSKEKRNKKESFYRKAGFQNMSYASSLLMALVSAIITAIACYVLIGNPFLAVVFFGLGWNIPGIISTFIVQKRLNRLNDQAGMFMRMVIKRYQVVGDFFFALGSTLEDFAGEEPMSTEMTILMNDIQRGEPISGALEDFANRCDNKFLRRFADYYTISAEIGTDEARKNVLEQALIQYEEHMTTMRELKKQLSELTMEAYVMLGFVPCVMLYQVKTSPDTYIPFMTETLMGQVGLAVITLVCMIVFWVINTKLAAPLDKD